MSTQAENNPIKMSGMVAANVDLQSVALRSISAHCESDPFAPPQLPAGVQIQLHATHEVAWRYRPEEKLLDVKISFSTQGKEKATNLERLRVNCEFNLRYALFSSLD